MEQSGTSVVTATLRSRLREDTRVSHEDLDSFVMGLDLACYQDLCVFVRAHALAFAVLDEAFKGEHPLVAERLLSTSRDLEDLKAHPPALQGLDISRPLDPVGITYVIAGAHLGGKVLSTRVAASTDPRIGPLRLFEAGDLPAIWSDLVTALKKRPAEGVEADRIVMSALDCFGVFRTAFEHQTSRK